jgi:hypothetical protein
VNTTNLTFQHDGKPNITTLLNDGTGHKESRGWFRWTPPAPEWCVAAAKDFRSGLDSAMRDHGAVSCETGFLDGARPVAHARKAHPENTPTAQFSVTGAEAELFTP